MRNVPFIDATGMHNFMEVLKTMKSYKVKVILSGLQQGVYDELVKSSIEKYIPRDNLCFDYECAKSKAEEIIKTSGKANLS